jgi:hypothetical protein
MVLLWHHLYPSIPFEETRWSRVTERFSPSPCARCRSPKRHRRATQQSRILAKPECGKLTKRQPVLARVYSDGVWNKRVLVVLTGIPSHPRDGLLALAKRSRQGRPASEATATRRQIQIRLSPDDIDRLVAAYQAGGRTTPLAVEFGVHRNTVQRLLKARGAHPSAARAHDAAERTLPH